MAAAVVQQIGSAHALWNDFLNKSNLYDFEHQKEEFNDIVCRINDMRAGNQLMSKPCRVVYAPRGLGKTTLLTNMAEHLPSLLNSSSDIDLPALISVYCSMKYPNSNMASLLTTIQHALPEDHAGRHVSTLFELAPKLTESKHVVAIFVDDVEQLYTRKADRLAKVSGANIAELAKAWDIRDASPGVCVAKQWLNEFDDAAGKPEESGFRVMVVLSASQASIRQLLYHKVDLEEDKDILSKYPLYPRVRIDLNDGKYKMTYNMARSFWHGAGNFNAFLAAQGVVWPPEPDDAPAQHVPLSVQAAKVFAASTAMSLRCATVFAETLVGKQRLRQLSSTDIWTAARAVPSAGIVEADSCSVRTKLYRTLIFRTSAGIALSGPLEDLQSQEPFAYEKNKFKMNVSALLAKSDIDNMEFYRALDQGVVCFVDACAVGIPCLRAVLQFLAGTLNPYEASCLTYTAGTSGVDAEPIVGWMLRNMLKASLTSGVIPSSFKSTQGGQAWSAAVFQALQDNRAKVSSSELSWASIARFKVESAEPVLPIESVTGFITFAKEHTDSYGGDLISVIVPRDGEASVLSEAAPRAAASAEQGTDIYVWRVQVKLCSTPTSSIKPGRAEQICDGLLQGQPSVLAAVHKALARAHVNNARIHVLNSIATTRKVSEDAEAVMNAKGVVLFGKELLAQHWDPEVSEFAESASLSMYLPQTTV